MSTREWTHPITETKYYIGTVGIETAKSEVFFDFIKNIPANLGMLGDIIIPTYGLWAGPGYSGGERPTSNTDIDWNNVPCMKVIKGSSLPLTYGNGQR